jgi:Tfp pilus assembly protein PilF
LAISRDLFGNTHRDVADALHFTAEALENEKKLAAAEMLYREALAVQNDLDDTRLDRGHLMQHLGRVLAKQSKMEEAESYYREAVAFQRGRFGEAHPDVARSLRELGAFLSRNEKNDEGERTTREALSIFKQLSGDHPEVIQTLEDLARVLREKGQVEEATAAWREIVRAQRNIPGSQNIKFAKNLGYLASILEEQGHIDEAERTYREALVLVRKVAGGQHTATVAAGIKLGRVLEQQGKLAEAESTYSAVVKPFYNAPATRDTKALNAVAWLLATCNLPAIRDGSTAVRIASQVVKADRDYDTLATLAAARAEVGDFAAATNFQREAMAMLRDKNKVEEFSSRLSLYASNKACRDPLQPATTVSASQANAAE